MNEDATRDATELVDDDEIAEAARKKLISKIEAGELSAKELKELVLANVVLKTKRAEAEAAHAGKGDPHRGARARGALSGVRGRLRT